MKKIFLDTNFIIDYFVREDFNGVSEQLLTLGKNNLKPKYRSWMPQNSFGK